MRTSAERSVARVAQPPSAVRLKNAPAAERQNLIEPSTSVLGKD